MIEGTVGIWINKRSVIFLDLPFRHRLVGEATGWRIEILEPGKVLVHGRKDERGIDVEEGDFLLSAGEDIYVALHRMRDESHQPRTDDPTRDTPPEHGEVR